MKRFSLLALLLAATVFTFAWATGGHEAGRTGRDSWRIPAHRDHASWHATFRTSTTASAAIAPLLACSVDESQRE